MFRPAGWIMKEESALKRKGYMMLSKTSLLKYVLKVGFYAVLFSGFLLSTSCRTHFGRGGSKGDPVCGDGILDDGEECDDGNTEDGDGCDSECRVEPGWHCEGEPSVCVHTCGDGIRQEWEECDGSDLGGHTCESMGEGFTGGELGCNEDCTFDTFWCILPSCGDGVLDFGEECDEGENNSNSGSCLVNCRKAVCGDGFLWEGVEECDDGPMNSDTAPNACRTDCRLPRCGDGVVDSGEECDDGPMNSNTTPNACRTDCRLPRCGDGIVDSGEECDDGNNISGDGCSSDCRIENLPILHWLSSGSTWWNQETVYFAWNQHAPTTPIVAAANVQERNEIYVFTRSTYHVLQVPSRNWIAHGTLSSSFSGLPTATFHAAYGVSWPSTASTDITFFNGSQYYLYKVSTSFGTISFNTSGTIDWSYDPLAPNPANVKAVFLALENNRGWVDCSPNALCGGGGSVTGPYAALLGTNNLFYIQESGYCFQVCYSTNASGFQPFSLTGAPQASRIQAMAYANGGLYVFTQTL